LTLIKNKFYLKKKKIKDIKLEINQLKDKQEIIKIKIRGFKKQIKTEKLKFTKEEAILKDEILNSLEKSKKRLAQIKELQQNKELIFIKSKKMHIIKNDIEFKVLKLVFKSKDSRIPININLNEDEFSADDVLLYGIQNILEQKRREESKEIEEKEEEGKRKLEIKLEESQRIRDELFISQTMLIDEAKINENAISYYSKENEKLKLKNLKLKEKVKEN